MKNPKKKSTSKAELPIQISIGYGWSEHGSSENGLHEHWAFLRDATNGVIDSFMKESEKAGSPFNKVKRPRVARLRATHGVELMKDILKRIDSSDILIFDISGDNPNVLLELGYSIAKHKIKKSKPRIYVFERCDKKTPSDLSGILITKYDPMPNYKPSNKKVYAKLKDTKGFRSAILGALKEISAKKTIRESAVSKTYLEL